jgi:protein-arginine kinase activator protein McsA
MKCEACRENEAVCHLTFILGQQQFTKHFCSECYTEQASPAEQAFLKEAPGKACDCCGSKPCFVATDIVELCLGRQKSRFLCRPCSQEFNRIIQQEAAVLEAVHSEDMQRAELEALRSRIDEQMRRWSSRRLT